MFGLSSTSAVGQLEQTVEAKKQTVTSSTQQLQELEARLRETEQRLAQVYGGSSPLKQPGVASSVPGRLQAQQASSGAAAASSAEPSAARRPQNAREDTQTMIAGMPGALPQTPRGYSSGSQEYVMVDRNAPR
ncbi:hypothetical protein BAUCODRAFT_25176 [Baudoinia panamericana UAMH 10762]|uniref:Uncharacterized protein n=1 Tax=Baudoinia panamericana (strain UAMH 10762) TaxID=717646 RepID=M2N7L5_BAUPA|nr:uncharacterized protein BAUCODRAFT_25176 [Baudoinia panamericana UAMH 10762]EMC95054.1 hypothetical protein BAUCODRAFT_25176 [Baudoinia panamericana UAMH 10762]